MTERKQYQAQVGLDYPSIKDGKRRFAKPGDVVDDLPPSDATWMLEQGAITVDGEPAETVPEPEPQDAVVPEPTEGGE